VVVKVPPSVFYLVLFFVLVPDLPLPTNYLTIMVDVVPVSRKAPMGTTVPSLFLTSPIVSAVYCTGLFSGADSGSCFSLILLLNG
jgi:hypothetical protein